MASAPRAGTPSIGETVGEGRVNLTITEITADAIRLEDSKGKRHVIRLDPGVRFDWNADRDRWELHP